MFNVSDNDWNHSRLINVINARGAKLPNATYIKISKSSQLTEVNTIENSLNINKCGFTINKNTIKD